MAVRYGRNILRFSSVSLQYTLSTFIPSPKYLLLNKRYSASILYKNSTTIGRAHMAQ